MRLLLGPRLALLLLATSADAVLASDAPAQFFLEATAPLTREQRNRLNSAGVEVGPYLGQNRYRATVRSGADKLPELTREFEFVREVRPVAPAEKIDAALLQGEVPPHARIGTDRIRIAVRFVPSVGESRAAAILSEHGTDVRRRDELGIWEATVPKRVLEALSASPEITRVEAAPHPRLL